MSSFVFKDNSEVFLDAFKDAIDESGKEMSVAARDAVQYQILYGYNDPHGEDGHTEIVETGKLFDSIKGVSIRASENLVTVTVGTDVPYAKHVHEGTMKLKARRFMRDGLSKASAEFERIALKCMKNA